MSNFQQGWQPQQPPFYGQPLPDVVYDGNAREQISMQIFLGLLVAVTLGLAAPYAICTMHREDAEHTIIGGRRLRFDGQARELFSLMFVWGILSILTLGIYSFWARVNYKKWIAENTHFA